MEMSVGLSSSVKGGGVLKISLCPLAFSRFSPSPPSSTSKFLFRFSSRFWLYSCCKTKNKNGDDRKELLFTDK
ncbi:hypothetical protein Godav_013623 [Gossypium davidsonii]|uniref:Uncharacterized protein n=1 Tax=Gossypium davidsonii TaxID=34287 RepID=A0A7J8RH33_GOSDV|nr:hypothetical protein [Gossypium davidsonii]